MSTHNKKQTNKPKAYSVFFKLKNTKKSKLRVFGAYDSSEGHLGGREVKCAGKS